jgi:drug/metabolite transporter (DMT)-like permease
MPYVVFLFICGVWGSSFILMKKAAVCFSPTAVGAWRLVGGAAVLGAVWWWRSERWPLTKRDLPAMAFVVLIGFVWPFSIQPYLITRDGSAFIGMTVSLTPLLTILASIPILGAYPARRQGIGVLGALVFMALLMRDGLEREIPLRDLVCAVSIPLCYAVTNTVIRRWLQHVPALDLTFLSVAAAGAIMLPLSLVLPAGGAEATSSEFLKAVAALAFLGVIGTGLSAFLFNQLIQQQGPLFAGMVTNLVPIGAVLWGWIDGEQVTARQLEAVAGIVAMVTLVQYGAARR